MRRECREHFPRHRFQRKPLVSNPDMHHGTCVTHVPWCMSRLLSCRGGENVTGILGACATRNVTYLQETHWCQEYSIRPHLCLAQVLLSPAVLVSIHKIWYRLHYIWKFPYDMKIGAKLIELLITINEVCLMWKQWKIYPPPPTHTRTNQSKLMRYLAFKMSISDPCLAYVCYRKNVGMFPFPFVVHIGCNASQVCMRLVYILPTWHIL